MLKISIALTTFNGEKYLREQLDSIAKQSRLPDELVVCDDRSTDKSLDVLHEYRGQVPFPVTVISNEERLGFARNFSKAIDLCSGDVVFPCDQDDVWLETKLLKHESVYLEQPDVGMIVNDGRLVDPDLKPMGKTWFEAVGFTDREFEELESDQAFPVLTRDSRFCGCMMSFRARFLSQVAPMPERIGHDDWLALNFSLLSRLKILREPLNDYRQHVSQVTRGIANVKSQFRSDLPPRASKQEKRAIDLYYVLEGLKDLESSGETLRYPGFHDYLKGHICHNLRRSMMPNNLIKRIPLVLIEFVLGNYARYNNSVKNNLSYDLRPKFFR
jgi:glycosyltransferase involved in cell wall biosynthesis